MSETPSGWAVGWAYFAAVMLMMAGAFQAIAGIAGIFSNDFYVVGREWVFSLDATQWGWVHLIVGVLLILCGFGVLSGNVAARTVGVIIAGLSAIASFAFVPWYPVWSIAVIAIDVAVIWALTAHGRDVQTI
jgi:hypothetical protein